MRQQLLEHVRKRGKHGELPARVGRRGRHVHKQSDSSAEGQRERTSLSRAVTGKNPPRRGHPRDAPRIETAICIHIHVARGT